MPEQDDSKPGCSRRQFLRGGVALGSGLLLPKGAWGGAPAVIRREGQRPGVPSGVQTGDVSAMRAVVWSRTDRPARMVVEWSASPRFRDPRRVVGPAALEVSDYTARVELSDLPKDSRIFYRVRFEDLAEPGVSSEPVGGSFRTAPVGRRTLQFAWSGDVCGQGWGIDPGRGGMRTWETM
ncbi:MAG TPA: PhoD-like phosphatase N-terminal domain-containing protein, partial [Armatimonadota bacterium]|nr:PhoD-like phosphatase N-terminal domain-containing protein [Armatimonadota bacterium]